MKPRTAAAPTVASSMRAVDTRGGASHGTGDPRSPTTYASTSTLVSTAVARPALPATTRLAQALLVPPDLLVLDEPWEGIDIDTRELVPEIIDEVLAAGGSVLVSDHSGDTGHLPGVTEWAVVDGTVEVVTPGKRSEDRRSGAGA